MATTAVKEVPKDELPSGITMKQYKFVCQFIWGNELQDIGFAVQSGLWKRDAEELLKRYPQLEKSYDEEYQRNKQVTT